MPVRVSTLDPQTLEPFLAASTRVVRQCLVTTDLGTGLLASPTDGKHPFISVRQQALGAAVLAELGDLATAERLCDFLLQAQSPGGGWINRFDAQGGEAHDRVAPDTTAVAMWAILSVIRASNDEQLAERAREHIDEAARWVIDRGFNPYIYLVESPGTGDADGNEGFDLWCNCAHAAAFALGHRVYGGDRFRRLALLMRRAIGQLLTHDHRFLRGLTDQGFPDPRPDMSLLSPFYFGLWPASERTVINSVDLIEKTLWNVEIGGFARMLPYSPAQRRLPPGPMPHVSAWMACYHYDMGNADRAEAIVRWLLESATDGDLPEVRVPRMTAFRFLDECRRGLEAIGPSASPTDRGRTGQLALLRERRLSDLQNIGSEAERQDVADGGRPFVWAHLETLRALKRGGYISSWAVERD